MDKLKIFDAFCGVGGIRLGFELANDDIFTTVYAVDFNQMCKKTYDLNFKESKLTIQDISKLKINEIPDFDIITAGFPCQPYSIAGNRKGLQDDRGKIVYDLLKIIKNKKPKIVFLENVKNFRTIHDGKPYKLVIDKLIKYGYNVKDKVLNTYKYTQVPQNRERIFIIGFLDKKVFEYFDFPTESHSKKSFKNYLEKNIPQKYFYSEKSLIYPKLKETVINENSVYQYRRHYVRENKNNNVPTLTSNMGGGGHNVPIIVSNNKIRKLTPKECFNLQGFPSTYQLPDISDSNLYKQVGNSVTVKLIKKIAKNIYCALRLAKNDDILLHRLEEIKLIIKGKLTIHDKEYSCNYISYDLQTTNMLTEYYSAYKVLNNLAKKIQGRSVNLSEAFTEGIYCYITNSVRVLKIFDKNESSSIDCYNLDKKKSIQIKSSIMDIDCSSFGPKSVFDELVYIDFSNDNIFRIYEIDNKYLKNVIVCKSKNETLDDQKNQLRRPRFSIMTEIIHKYNIKPSIIGNMNNLEQYYKILRVDNTQFVSSPYINKTTANIEQ